MAKKKAKKKMKKSKKKVVRKAKKLKRKAMKKTRKTKKKMKKTKKKARKAKGKKTRASGRPAGLRKKPTVKPMKAKKSQAISSASAAVMQRLIGKVVHYYDRIGVAIVDLKEPLRVGDIIMLKKGDTIVPQRVESMQIEHASVTAAKRGDVVGLKVDAEAHEGTLVLPG